MAWLREPAAAARGSAGQRASRPQGERKARRKMLRLDCFGDSLVFPRRCRAGEGMRAQRAEYDATRPAGASAGTLSGTSFDREDAPSVPKGTDGRAATKPVCHVGNGFVEAARISGGQPLLRSGQAQNCQHARRNGPASTGMRCFQRVVANRAAHRDSRMNRGSPALQAVMPGAMETGRRRRWKPPSPPPRSLQTADGYPQWSSSGRLH